MGSTLHSSTLQHLHHFDLYLAILFSKTKWPNSLWPSCPWPSWLPQSCPRMTSQPAAPPSVGCPVTSACPSVWTCLPSTTAPRTRKSVWTSVCSHVSVTRTVSRNAWQQRQPVKQLERVSSTP